MQHTKSIKYVILIGLVLLTSSCDKGAHENNSSTGSNSLPPITVAPTTPIVPPTTSNSQPTGFYPFGGEYQIPATYVEINGKYDTVDKVAAYLVSFHKMPSNYNTNVCSNRNSSSSKGLSCGGKNHGNYEGRLPKSGRYQELDINAPCPKARGVERIVWDVTKFDVYYTGNHYESFKKFVSIGNYTSNYPM